MPTTPQPPPNHAVAITFTPPVGGGKPTFVFNPATRKVPYGNGQGQTITWTLTLSGGSGTLAFPATGGVILATAWQTNHPNNPAPTMVSGNPMAYQIVDNNRNTSKGSHKYSYTVNVLYNSISYSSDPEIENETKPGS